MDKELFYKGRNSPFIVLKKKEEQKKDITIFGEVYSSQNWIVDWDECQAWVEELIVSIRNKQTFYLMGLTAMALIQQTI